MASIIVNDFYWLLNILAMMNYRYFKFFMFLVHSTVEQKQKKTKKKKIEF